MDERLVRRRTFDDVVEAYEAVRPSYPPALFDVLFDLLPDEPHILEVGPGTGQATRDLLARGASVHAVELGANLAERLRARFPTDRLQVTNADFETVDVAPASVDAVVAATAYHWISSAAQTDRPAHVLRAGGMVAIIDLIQVAAPEDRGFFAAAQPIYERHGQAHSGPPPPARNAVAPEIRDALEADERFTDVALHAVDWDQTYRAAEYRQLMSSYSVTQLMNEPTRSHLLDEIEQLVRSDFGGSVTRPLVAALTTAVRA